jgi:hypothetical protein
MYTSDRLSLRILAVRAFISPLPQLACLYSRREGLALCENQQ